jgi:SAM-dependent methyltransferase
MEADADADTTTWDHVGPIIAGLPWDDLTFAGVVCNHMLQALPWPELLPALVEMRRVLAHKGVLRLLVPDLIRAFEAFQAADAGHFLVGDDIETTLDGKFAVYVTQAGATRSVFTRGYLRDLLWRAGFSEVETTAFGVSLLGPEWLAELDSREGESIIMEARK